MLAILFFANVLLCIWKNVDRKEGISMCILYLSSGFHTAYYVYRAGHLQLYFD